MNKQKGVSILAVVIIIIVVAIVSTGGVLLYQYLTTQQVPPTQPSITVTSPTGGEQWVQGQTYTIKWISNGIDKVFIGFTNEDSAKYGNGIFTPSGPIPSSGSFSYTISDNMPVGNKYKIFVESGDASTSSIRDESDNYFTISVTVKPAITVTSPVANQTIKSPVKISGNSATWEGTVNIRIKDNNNKILANKNTMGGGAPGPASPFSKDVVYTAPSASKGVVEVFEVNQKDGSETNKVSIPVVFGDYTDLTAGWKTYTNTTYNYSIKYPSDWSYSTSNGLTLYCDYQKRNYTACTGLEGVGIGDLNPGVQINIEPKILEEFKKDLVLRGQEDYILDGVKGVKIIGGPVMGIGVDYTNIFVTKNDINYLIIMPPSPPVVDNQILSTFKFTK